MTVGELIIFFELKLIFYFCCSSFWTHVFWWSPNKDPVSGSLPSARVHAGTCEVESQKHLFGVDHLQQKLLKDLCGGTVMELLVAAKHPEPLLNPGCTSEISAAVWWSSDVGPFGAERASCITAVSLTITARPILLSIAVEISRTDSQLIFLHWCSAAVIKV